MSITVLQPDPFVPLDRYESWLSALGQNLITVALYDQDVPSLAECGDGIILLGGTMDALDTSKAPWLPALRSLLHDAKSANLPVLGICLGHQIVADAFGGTVEVGHPTQGEEGPVTLTLTEEGLKDPFFTDLPQTFTSAESHHDVVTKLPEGATLLASSEVCPLQSFRLGSIITTQFHPEASPETVALWANMTGGDAPVVESEMKSRDLEHRASGEILAKNFAESLDTARDV